MTKSSSTDHKKKTGCGCLGGFGNAAGCLIVIAIILGIAIYIAVEHPGRVQYFLDWVGTLQ